jgi:molecular chaperone DnaK (HSP70)
MSGWAMDLGTTNTGLAFWDGEQPKLVELPNICRRPHSEDALEAPWMIPSAVHLIEELGWLDRMGQRPWLRKRMFLGKSAHIGRVALEMNEGRIHPQFAMSFKRLLGRTPLQTVARCQGKWVAAREVARHFLQGLFQEVKEVKGERIRELVVTSPVDSFERYRAEVRDLLRSVGVDKVRFIDEPVAAALGYGLGLREERRVLIVDFGGGTLDLALVKLTARGTQQGMAEVVAKAGRPIGGDLIDRWLLQHFCDQKGYELREEQGEDSFWYRLMLREVCRVKEALLLRPSELFQLVPPEDHRQFEARLRKEQEDLPEMTREGLVDVLASHGLYDALERCLDEVLKAAPAGAQGAIDDVLMVGGSTLLPSVYDVFEQRFGRQRVRAWQPFEAVASGASAFAAGQFNQADHIVHDYAFRTHDLKTREVKHAVIVPQGTRIPTTPNFWTRQLVPTCSLGEPETIFKLVICEIGRDHGEERRFVRDQRGGLHRLGGRGDSGQVKALKLAEEPVEVVEVVVPLNEANPTLGVLKPPHMPGDTTPRLEISFGVNAERWLCATVKDLKTGRVLMQDEPVVRLI